MTLRDLQVPPGPGAPKGLTIPVAELVEQFSHASGPGGQGVNTTDSRVQLRFDIGSSTALNPRQRDRIVANLQPRLAGTVLTVTAAEHRSQWRNRAAARQRLALLLRQAVAPKPMRKRTKPTRGSQRRRRKAKQIRSEIKQQRKRPMAD